MVVAGQPGCSPFLALVTAGWAASGSVPSSPGDPCIPDGRQLLFPAPVARLPRLPRSKVAAHMRQYSYGPN